MVRPTSEARAEGAADRDERLGEAIEDYLALAEAGQAPEAQGFAARYPDIEEDLLAAIEGLALVRGLVGEPCGPGHRLESGHRVAGYRIVRELGRGGMGIVYEAVHVGLDRPVALKVLGSSAAPDSSGRRRFLNEARTAAGLHHTHIVPVFDVGQVGGLCYYAMQRIEGAGLDRVIKHLRHDRSVAAGSTYPGRTPSNPAIPMVPDLSGTGLLGESTATWGAAGRSKLAGLGRRPEDEATPFEPPRGSAYYRWVAAVGRQAAEALAHAHQRGVIHRDVKPSNLLVDARGAVWMADFGLARRLADPSQTQIDSLLGTPRYMSPEQARTGPIDGRSDVYSLGATLYELLTLRPPFEGKTAAELIDQIAGREPVSIHAIDPRVPRDLETIVLKALHKRAADRYATAAELSEDLERFLNHEPVRARRIGPLGRAWRVARRHPSLTAVSTVATAVVLATAAFAYVRVVHERDQKAAALFDQLRQNVAVQRLSGAAGRRDVGLSLLKEAAALAPGAVEKAKLRDEAVAFLSLRDVGERREIPVSVDERASGLALDADGRHLAVLSGDYADTVRFYDVETRTQIATRSLAADRPPAGGPRPQVPVAGPGQGRGGLGRGPGFRPGMRIAAAGSEVAVIQPDGRGVSLLDASTGAHVDGGELRLFDRPGQPPREIVSLAISADGDRLVTVDHPLDVDGPRRGRFEFSVHLWDTAAPGKLLATLYEPPGSPGELGRGGFPLLVAISPDGATVAVAMSWLDPEISIWTRDGKSRATIDSQSQLSALAIGPSGLLAAAGNRAVHLWDLARPGSSLTSLTPDIGRVDQLRFGPENRALLAVGGPSDVELWDVGAMARVAKLPTVEGGFVGIPLALGGKTLALGLPSSLTLWSVVDPKVQAQIAGFRGGPASLAFSAAGELAMATNDGEVRLWTTGHCPTTARSVDSLRANALAFDAKGLLIAQGRDALLWLDDGGREVARAALPKAVARGGQRGGDPTASTSGRIARSADGRTIVMTRGRDILLGLLRGDGAPEPIVKLTADGPEPIGPDRPPLDPPTPPRGGGGQRSWRDLALSPDGRRLFLISIEEAGAWAVEGDRLRRLPWPFPARAVRLAMAPDGRTIAVACATGPGGDPPAAVLLLDASDGRVLHRLEVAEEGAGGFFAALAFSPDGRELAVGSRDQTRLWSLGGKTPVPFVRLGGHHGPVSVLAYDPEGRHLASGSVDGTVKVWDLDHVRNELAGLGLD